MAAADHLRCAARHQAARVRHGSLAKLLRHESHWSAAPLLAQSRTVITFRMVVPLEAGLWATI